MILLEQCLILFEDRPDFDPIAFPSRRTLEVSSFCLYPKPMVNKADDSSHVAY